MPKVLALTVDDRHLPDQGEISDESYWAASIAAGHVTRTLRELQSPLTAPRAYLVADMSDSDGPMKARLSDMTLSSRASAPPYLTQIIEGIRNISMGDMAEFEMRLQDVDSDFFYLDLPVKKSRSIREAKLTWTISASEGARYTLSVEHSRGRSLYSLPYDDTEYAIAKGVAQSISVTDKCPIFESSRQKGYFKAAPSFEAAEDYFDIPDSFFLSGGWARR